LEIEPSESEDADEDEMDCIDKKLIVYNRE